jgi:hypothetical protein
MNKFKSMVFGLAAFGTLAMSFSCWAVQSYAQSDMPAESSKLALTSTASTTCDYAGKDVCSWRRHRRR